MKIIKYNDRGKAISSEQAHLPEIEGARTKEKDTPELNIVTPLTRKRTIRGAIVGVFLGIPLGALLEMFRLLTGEPWDDFFWGIVVFAATLLISTGVGYLLGTMTDRE